MKTLFRATIMLCVLGVAAWAMVEYGVAGAVRPIATHAIELADRLIGRPGVVAAETAPRTVNTIPLSVPQLQLAANAKVEPITGSTGRSLIPPSQSPIREIPAKDDLAKVGSGGPVAKLKWLGARDVAVSPWGSSGQLHRVCCEIPLSPAEGATRHFEAVATSLDEAASLVLAEVRTWQAAQGSLAAQ